VALQGAKSIPEDAICEHQGQVLNWQLDCFSDTRFVIQIIQCNGDGHRGTYEAGRGDAVTH
jgi:hypothetical protein